MTGARAPLARAPLPNVDVRPIPLLHALEVAGGVVMARPLGCVPVLADLVSMIRARTVRVTRVDRSPVTAVALSPRFATPARGIARPPARIRMAAISIVRDRVGVDVELLPGAPREGERARPIAHGMRREQRGGTQREERLNHRLLAPEANATKVAERAGVDATSRDGLVRRSCRFR